MRRAITACVEPVLNTGDVIADKYVIERELGRGGMGAVFEVSHCTTGKRFAVKLLLPGLAGRGEAVSRFIREAQVVCRIEHPNVVEVYDVGQDDGACYMVMELLRGESLAQRLKRVSKLDPLAACRILIPVARAVSAAHAVSVIHRDLKPDNIFLCRTQGGDEVPKVLDFGIAKLLKRPEGVAKTLTAMGAIVGTPLYMAPEQISGQEVDARTDVYALGLVLYEMLVGSTPFISENYPALVLEILTGRVASRLSMDQPTLPRALIDIVEKAMARDPQTRFASVDALLSRLTAYAGDSGSASVRSLRASVWELDTPNTGPVELHEARVDSAVRERSLHTSDRGAADSGTHRNGRLHLRLAVSALIVIGGGYVLWQLTQTTAEPHTPLAAPRSQSPAISAQHTTTPVVDNTAQAGAAIGSDTTSRTLDKTSQRKADSPPSEPAPGPTPAAPERRSRRRPAGALPTAPLVEARAPSVPAPTQTTTSPPLSTEAKPPADDAVKSSRVRHRAPKMSSDDF